ncbi:unnamed protein product [Fusarium equiseti]|uniref:Uncharacterized protein n=1 Tax=Fusarium equiseti TaxID=61235 RepID=A0A8J2N6W5_FUSEQ|nr:unnamed protein product [Fusarium equiseti]
MLRPCSEDGQAPNDSQNASDNEQSIPPPYQGDQENDGPGSDNSDDSNGFISQQPGQTVTSTGSSSSSDSLAETSPSQPTESNAESPHLGTVTLPTQIPITTTIVVTGLGPDMGDEKETSASLNLTPTPSFVRADGPPGLVTPVPSLVESSDTQRSREISPLLLAGLYLGLMMSLAAFLVSPEAIVSIVALVLLIRLMTDRL